MESKNNKQLINNILCSHHPKQTNIYICKTCENQLACRKCVTNVHQNHSLMDIEDLNNNEKLKDHSNSISKILDTVSKIYNSLKEDSNNYFKQLQDSQIEYINRLELEYYSFKNSILSKENELYEQVFKSVISNLNSKKRSLKDENDNNIYFKVYENGDDISNITNNCLAINYGHHLPETIPKNINSLLLPDNFDQNLNLIPSNIHTLYLFDIQFQLSSYSIPRSIKTIAFCDGFSQKIKNITLSDGIDDIILGDTVHPLEFTKNRYGILPNIYIMTTYKHQSSK